MVEPALRLLVDDRAALLLQQPFLARLALELELQVDPLTPTAWTNGREILVNPRYVLTLDALGRRHLLAHLVWHCALQHPWRRQGREGPAWDLAVDHEVNALLAETLPLPEHAIYFEERASDGAEVVYDWLLTLPSLPERSPRSDVHADALDPRAMDRGLERRWAERVLAVTHELTRVGHPVSAAVLRWVGQLRASHVPWRELLRRFLSPVLGDRRQWLPPSRRHLHRGLYLPSRRHQLLRVVVGLDTSASTLELQSDLLRELMGILGATEHHELVLLMADHELRACETYSPDRPLDPNALVPLGGGGTDLRLFFSAIEARGLEPAVAIVLTDGLGPTPAFPPHFPVLWALPAVGRVPAAWGEIVRFD